MSENQEGKLKHIEKLYMSKLNQKGKAHIWNTHSKPKLMVRALNNVQFVNAALCKLTLQISKYRDYMAETQKLILT